MYTPLLKTFVLNLIDITCFIHSVLKQPLKDIISDPAGLRLDFGPFLSYFLGSIGQRVCLLPIQ